MPHVLVPCEPLAATLPVKLTRSPLRTVGADSPIVCVRCTRTRLAPLPTQNTSSPTTLVTCTFFAVTGSPASDARLPPLCESTFAEPAVSEPLPARVACAPLTPPVEPAPAGLAS